MGTWDVIKYALSSAFELLTSAEFEIDGNTYSPFWIMFVMSAFTLLINAFAKIGIFNHIDSVESYDTYAKKRFTREKYDLKYNNRHSIRKSN